VSRWHWESGTRSYLRGSFWFTRLCPHWVLPAKALCPPEHVDAVRAQFAFAKLTNGLDEANSVPSVLFEQAMQQQQQQ